MFLREFFYPILPPKTFMYKSFKLKKNVQLFLLGVHMISVCRNLINIIITTRRLPVAGSVSTYHEKLILMRLNETKWKISNAMETLVYLIRILCRSKLGDHVFFDDYLIYLNFNFVSDEICSHYELNAIKILYKMSQEWSCFVKFWRRYCKKSVDFNVYLNFKKHSN